MMIDEPQSRLRVFSAQPTLNNQFCYVYLIFSLNKIV